MRFKLARSGQEILRLRQTILLQMSQGQIEQGVDFVLELGGPAGLVFRQSFLEKVRGITEAFSGLAGQQHGPCLVVEELGLFTGVRRVRSSAQALEELRGLS